ncbi:MAG: hypothetical protein KJ077_10730 [Anaerolineae bacterium]|nr:hypothetical protein [Anaerolineae bacterium]
MKHGAAEKTNLLGWYHEGEALTERVLYFLSTQGIRKIVDLPNNGGVIVQTGFNHNPEFPDDNNYQWFLLGDNGGEITVLHLNHHDSDNPRNRSVPTTSDNYDLTVDTIGYRIFTAIWGREIDYDLRLPGERIMHR